jgi:hypothetical protein
MTQQAQFFLICRKPLYSIGISTTGSCQSDNFLSGVKVVPILILMPHFFLDLNQCIPAGGRLSTAAP